MTTPEFSRMFDVRQCEGRAVTLIADNAERQALALRFALVSIASLGAELVLRREEQGASATGTLRAEITQSCAVSGDDLPVSIDEPLTLRFVPASDHVPTEEEVELDADALDEIEFAGSSFDLGEAVAQSMALAIDP